MAEQNEKYMKSLGEELKTQTQKHVQLEKQAKYISKSKIKCRIWTY